LDLSARAVPLADVLRCLVEHAGLRVEYDGPPPRQLVSVALRGDSLASTLESLLEGLGVNYLLSRDPSGRGVERLIVFGASRATEPTSGRGARSSPSGGEPVEPMPAEPSPEDQAQPFGMPPEAPPGVPMPFSGLPPGAEPSSGAYEPGGAPEPPPVEPEELTPLTLQFNRGSGGRVAMGSSPVWWAPVTIVGTPEVLWASTASCHHPKRGSAEGSQSPA
ncbi:MAG TPA: hypothetical protein VEY33_14540, partial [Gemmatimonadota bacterium]|nr:hypothetical protein [Gemmatimonadota bacterium]